MTIRETSDEGIHLTEYFKLLLKYKILVFSSITLSATITLLMVLQEVPVYESTAVLFFERPVKISPLTGTPIEIENERTQSLSFNTHVNLLSSKPNLERVIDNLSLLNKPDKKDPKKQGAIKLYLKRVKNKIESIIGKKDKKASEIVRREALINALQDQIMLKPVSGTRLLNVVIKDKDPDMSFNIANELVNSYIEFNESQQQQSSKNSFFALQRQSIEMKKKLEESEKEFFAFKQQEKLSSLPEKLNAISNKISEFNNLSVINQNELQDIAARLNALQTLSTNESLEPEKSLSFLEFPIVVNLNKQLIEAEVELSQFKKVFRDKHAKVLKAKGRISDIKSAISEQLSNEVDNMKVKQSLLLDKRKNIENNIVILEQESLTLSKKELQYTTLKRNKETNQHIYDTLLAKMKESDITESMSHETIRIVEPAKRPLHPIPSKKKIHLLLSVILGFTGGAAIVFFIEYIDQTLRNENDVERYLDLPVLALIPEAPVPSTTLSKDIIHGNQ